MAESSGNKPRPIIGELPEGLDDEAREWIRKVVNMNDEDALKAMRERRMDNTIKNIWSRSYAEFLRAPVAGRPPPACGRGAPSILSAVCGVPLRVLQGRSGRALHPAEGGGVGAIANAGR